jgi:hypothetical protein
MLQEIIVITENVRMMTRITFLTRIDSTAKSILSLATQIINFLPLKPLSETRSGVLIDWRSLVLIKVHTQIPIDHPATPGLPPDKNCSPKISQGAKFIPITSHCKSSNCGSTSPHFSSTE